MSLPWGSRLSLALCLLALPLVAEAQLSQPRAEVSRWAFTTTVGQFHSDNLYFLSSGDPGDTIDTVSAGLLYGRSSPRSSLSAYGRVSGTHYWNFSQSSSIGYGGGVGASFRPSRTLAFTFGQAGGSGVYAPLLIGLGVQPAGVRADSLSTNLIADWQATPRTLLRIDGEVGYLHYVSELSDLDPSELPLDALVLAGVVSPEQAEIGIQDLPTPVDSSLVALRALSAEGVRGASLNLLTYRGGMVLTQNLAPKLTLSIPLGYRRLDYTNRLGLHDGGQFDTGLSLRRSLGTSTSASFQYTYQRNASQQPAVSTQTFMLQGEHEVSLHLKVDASVGIGLTSAGPLPVSSGTSLLGSLGLSGRARRTTWDLHYGRSTYQALGFGRNYLTDYASASVEHLLAKPLSVRLEARYRHSRESLIGAYAYDSQHYGAVARYRIKKRTMASAYYYWRILTRPLGQGDVSSSVWGFSIAYARSWKP